MSRKREKTIQKGPKLKKTNIKVLLICYDLILYILSYPQRLTISSLISNIFLNIH